MAQLQLRGIKKSYRSGEMDVPVPDEIDAASLAAGLKQHPPIPKYRPCNFETCVLSCPLARRE